MRINDTERRVWAARAVESRDSEVVQKIATKGRPHDDHVKAPLSMNRYDDETFGPMSPRRLLVTRAGSTLTRTD